MGEGVTQGAGGLEGGIREGGREVGGYGYR